MLINARRRQRSWLGISGVSGRCMFNVVLIACQTSCLTTVSLECLLECLSHFGAVGGVGESSLQAAWLFMSVKVSMLSREHRLD